MKFPDCFIRVLTALVATGMLVTGGWAQTKADLSDAEVQASVLRSLAQAPDWFSQMIQTVTNSGTVTLSGSVRDETQRTYVEQLVATTVGVRRVIDRLTLGGGSVSSQTPASPSQPDSTEGRVLQSDGTYATFPDAGLNASQHQVLMQQGEGSPLRSETDEVPPPNGPNTDAYGQPLNGQHNADPGGSLTPLAGTGYPVAQPGYGPRANPPDHNSPYGPERHGYNKPYSQRYEPTSGQPGGQIVTLQAGTLLRMRINQHLSSRDVDLGTIFDGMAVNDVIERGLIAIPRGTFLQGSVVEVESAGHLKGRGELGLKLTQITLGGKTYPVSSDVFSTHGGDKTIQTVNSSVGLGALGAILGAVAGGGVGAAIGAGAGGALGLGASAASGRGDAFLPSEVVLTFRLTQPLDVTTISQAEMQRLASSVPSAEGRSQGFGKYPYPYNGPGLYPRYYRPYSYYP